MDIREIFLRMNLGSVELIAGAPYQTGVPAKEAHVGWPIGVARRPNGDLVIVDWHCNRIWYIDSEGILHPFAGDGIPGDCSDGVPVIEARFDGPHSLVLDRNSNMYVADLKNGSIKKIDNVTGTISRVAGSGKVGRGGDGGLAVEAELDVTCGMAVDSNDDIYLSGEWTNTIRKIDAKTGVIEHFAGLEARNYFSETGDSRPHVGMGLEDWGGLSLGGYHGDGGPATEAGFFHNEHLAFNSKGDLYVCDNSNHRIRKIDMRTGIITTVLGNGMPASNGDGEQSSDASTLMPDAICFDVHDNMYVGEKYGYRVRKVENKTGVVTTLVGNGVPGFGEEDVLGSETTCNSVEAGIWADDDGTVFWCDCSGRVRRYDGLTGVVTTVLGGTSVHDGEAAPKGFLCAPQSVDVGPDGQIYIADMMNQRIRSISPETGIIRTVAGNGARAYGGDGGFAEEAYLSNPNDMSVDSRGRVVIADTRHGYVRRVDIDGRITTIGGTGFQWDKGDGGPAVSACFMETHAVSHDAVDNIYVADATIGKIRKIDSTTNIITTVAGTGISGYTGDGGKATEARIGTPTNIRFDDEGNLYFADSAYHVVRKIDKCGVIITVVGVGEEGFSRDGTLALAAKLSRPAGLAVSGGGVIYVSDSGNNCVRRVTRNGELETILGNPVIPEPSEKQRVNNLGLNEPHGLCLYNENVLLVTDHFNSRILAVKVGEY